MSIHLITGCMFSGKTSELIKVAKMNKLLNKNVLIINFLDLFILEQLFLCKHFRPTLQS